MTTTAITIDISSAIVAEFAGGQSNDVQMMIGVGLVKDSDAVFFQYLGDEQTPRALTMPTSGKPITRLSNVKLVGIDVAMGIGEFKSDKLNLFLETNQGNTVMVTSGIETIWSQCIITSLMGLLDAYSLDEYMTLDTWKGNSKMRPCFAAVRVGGQKISDQAMYDQLRELRSDGNKAAVKQTMLDAVNMLKSQLGGDVETVAVTEVKESAADF